MWLDLQEPGLGYARAPGPLRLALRWVLRSARALCYPELVV